MKKLDEAIERFSHNAEYERIHGSLQGCLEFRQLVEWLKDYKRILSKQKVGKWTKTRIRISSGDFTKGVKCSKCGYETVVDDFKYCPNCGNPKMEEGK